MSQLVLAAVLAGYLAVTPAYSDWSREAKHRRGARSPIRFSNAPLLPVLQKRVLTLEETPQPPCIHIRIDDAVYAIELRPRIDAFN